MAEVVQKSTVMALPVPMTPTARHRLSMFDRVLVWPAVVDAFRKLDPRVQWRNPVMFVVLCRQHPDDGLVGAGASGQGEAPAWFIVTCRHLAVVHRVVRQFRRGSGRRPQQGAGRHFAGPEAQRHGQEAGRSRDALQSTSRCGRVSCARATSCSWKRATTYRATAR